MTRIPLLNDNQLKPWAFQADVEQIYSVASYYLIKFTTNEREKNAELGYA